MASGKLVSVKTASVVKTRLTRKRFVSHKLFSDLYKFVVVTYSIN